MSVEETCEFDDISVIRETDAALLVVSEGEQMWVPKSQLLDGTEIDTVHDVGRMVIPHWLAEKKELV